MHSYRAGLSAVSLPEFLVAIGDDEKNERKVHKVASMLYFSYLGSRPLWTDFDKKWNG